MPEYLPAFQSDLEVVLEAVKNDHDALRWASPQLKRHRNFALRTVRANELALDYWVSDEFGILFGDLRAELQLAAASHLAAEGELAPVLTIDRPCLRSTCNNNMWIIMEVSGQKPIHRRICGPAVLVDSFLPGRSWPARWPAAVFVSGFRRWPCSAMRR